MRSDFAELLADAFFPLLFLLALEICELLESPAEPQKRSARLAIAYFAVVFAAVWLSNAPAGVIASYGSFALVSFVALTQKASLPWMVRLAGLVAVCAVCR